MVVPSNVTVVPLLNPVKSKVCPAGTVKSLITMLLHFFTVESEDKEDPVRVQESLFDKGVAIAKAHKVEISNELAEIIAFVHQCG